MVSFAINLEVRSSVKSQHNGTFRSWHEMQRKDTTLVKASECKTSSSFEKAGNIIATS